MKDDFVSIEHLLLALAKTESKARQHSEAERDRRKGIAGSPARHSRLGPRDRPKSRREVSSLAEIRHRPGPARRAREARSGDRPRSRNSPRHPGSLAANQEQSRADRRARRRQNGHRRRPRAADRTRRRAAEPQEQASDRARHGCADRRRQIPRRIRGAPEGRVARGPSRRRQCHSVHRRTAHRDRRGSRGRGRRRRQPAQARARPRRIALHRGHDARRISQAHRERRGPGAPLPTGVRRRTIGRRHDRDPARLEAALRSPSSRRKNQRLGARRGGQAVEALYHGSLSARQGDRPGRRSGQPARDGTGKRSHRDRRSAAAARATGTGRPPIGRRNGRAHPRAVERDRRGNGRPAPQARQPARAVGEPKKPAWATSRN